jgi:glutathione S-transferase
MDYIDVGEARKQSGLRLVLTTGVPGPWGEAAKGLFHVKRIPYAAVRQDGGQPNYELRAWTGFDNAPQAVYENERPRIGWSEIIFLAERLEPSPALVPADPRKRSTMFGLLHEIAGEMGFAWCRRLQLFRPILELPEGAAPAPLVESVARMAAKYGYSGELAERADARVIEILTLLGDTLRAQHERGSDFLVGDALSAVDIYWATFAAMIEPLPKEQCPMEDMLRGAYTVTDTETLEAADPVLLEHRDRMYRDHLQLPLDF